MYSSPVSKELSDIIWPPGHVLNFRSTWLKPRLASAPRHNKNMPQSEQEELNRATCVSDANLANVAVESGPLETHLGQWRVASR